jgi:DNA-binding Xre family transcriptional regulator
VPAPAVRPTPSACVDAEPQQSSTRYPRRATNHVRRIGYGWRLREMMNRHGMNAATQLLPPLAARGIRISAVAAWRLATQPPTRLSLPMLAALCDIFECSPADLIRTYAEDVSPRSPAQRNGRTMPQE